MTTRSRTITWDDPATLTSRFRTMSGPERVQAILDGTLPRPPVFALLGLDYLEARDGRTLLALDPGEHLYNLHGAVQGGILSAVLDAAMAQAVQSTLPTGAGMTTLNLNTTFLRAVTAATGRVRCIGEVLHTGGTVAAAQARIIDAEDRLYAHATATCAILRPRAAD